MIPYWILFALLAAGSILHLTSEGGRTTGTVAIRTHARQSPLLSLAGMLILVMIGLRFEVGGDWETYQRIFRSIGGRPFDRALATSDQEFAYTVLNWLAAQAGLGIWAVNLLCALPFVAGLMAISRQQPNPWLALAVATPVFIIVVGMGFSRQSAAVGFMMLGLADLLKGRSYWRFAALTLVGALFHQSVIILLPIVALFVTTFRLTSMILVFLVMALGYFILLPSIIETYSAGYIRYTYESQGAIYRIGLNALAGVLVLAMPGRFHRTREELLIWRGWAMMALASLIAFMFVESTVVLDRFGMYVLPLQIYAYARLPSAIARKGTMSIGWTAVVLVYSSAVLFVWLNYAAHARFWIPYDLYMF